jgi:hypothetical protein
MSLGIIFKQREQLGVSEPQKNALSEINTGNPVMYIKHHMDGSREIKFHVNLIDQLDKVFTKDGLRFLSIDQERFMSKFFEQAGIVTDRLDASDSQPYKDLDSVFKQLDDFLGSYHGVNNGRYTR